MTPDRLRWRLARCGLFLSGDTTVPLPTTTKGDLIVHNGTTDVRLPVGTDGQVLRADSADAEGVVWSAETVSKSGNLAEVNPTDGLSLKEGRGLRFYPIEDTTNYVELRAPDTLASSVSLQLPDTVGGLSEALVNAGGGTLGWQAFMAESTFDTYTTSLPMKYSAQAASTGNIASLSGDPGLIDGLDFSLFGGVVLLKDQTDPSENGLWTVNIDGPWSRDAQTFPSNAGLTPMSAIVPVNTGGTTNGNTLWYSRADGGGNVPFVQIPTTNSSTPLGSNNVIKSSSGCVTESGVTIDASNNLATTARINAGTAKIGATGAATTSCALEVSSTTGAFMLPRMTTTQRDALTAANGMLIYNTTDDKIQGREAGAWVNLV